MDFLCELAGGPGELARKSKLSRRVIDKYRSGNSDPSRERLIALADAGGVSVEWLATGKGPEGRPSVAPDGRTDGARTDIDKHLMSRALEGVRRTYESRKVRAPTIVEVETAW